MAPTYLLHRDAFCCLVDEGAVFLNARRCEYIAVSEPRPISELARGVIGWAAAYHASTEESPCDSLADSPLVLTLMRRGILTTSTSDGKRIEPVLLVTRKALPALPCRPHAPALQPGEILRFIRALGRVALYLRQRNLLHLLRRIEAAKAAPRIRRTTGPPRDIGLITRKFDRLRVWSYSAEGACLKDSLVLADFLLDAGELPILVIGVRSKPFKAHAWVQSGDVVLNDTVENVQRYTPILAI